MSKRHIYIYTAQTPAQTKNQENIKEDKRRRPRRRPPGKGTEMLIKTGGADPGADLQKQKKRDALEQFLVISLDFFGCGPISSLFQVCLPPFLNLLFLSRQRDRQTDSNTLFLGPSFFGARDCSSKNHLAQTWRRPTFDPKTPSFFIGRSM